MSQKSPREQTFEQQGKEKRDKIKTGIYRDSRSLLGSQRKTGGNALTIRKEPSSEMWGEGTSKKED